jgi:hypothetical protein
VFELGVIPKAKIGMVLQTMKAYKHLCNAYDVTHIKACATSAMPRECVILNPGSVGCPVFADIPFATSLEYRSPHARYAILTKRGTSWQVELLALDYDWAPRRRGHSQMDAPNGRRRCRWDALNSHSAGTGHPLLALFGPDGSNWRCPFMRAKRLPSCALRLLSF